ncbi:MAG: hypothetical protein LBE89_04035 [Helicobacteraceae bacterium]|jgi:BMFP domain-containing protein YqiC|nr:hypothetical protein [Helicobacteraceae bacterium]
MVRATLFICAIIISLRADSTMATQRDFIDFYASSDLVEQIRAHIMQEMNGSIEAIRAELIEQAREDGERHRRVVAAQSEELSRQIAKLREELDFLRELVVDINYQRNSRDDTITLLQKRVDELEARLNAIDTNNTGSPPPEIPAGGRKL